jgi:hypothetical protein
MNILLVVSGLFFPVSVKLLANPERYEVLS